MRQEEFVGWLAAAKKGDTITYFSGHLAEARRTDPDLHKLALSALASGGYRRQGSSTGESDYYAYDPDHRVCLVQRRVGDEFEYLAVRR